MNLKKIVVSSIIPIALFATCGDSKSGICDEVKTFKTKEILLKSLHERKKSANDYELLIYFKKAIPCVESAENLKTIKRCLCGSGNPLMALR